ncbi:sugar-transfer associated ATP-grasp domain-containing protein [Facklamia sp. P12945]|uniref:sugar-transfer associated ATP-grasp domain-containing protein n=1 Tax=Facklamia sp. P12945 TaxID=3421950 RepID=UPI003D17E3E6
MGKISRSIRNLRNNMLALRYVLKEEKSYNSDLAFLKKIKILFKGFSSEKYYLYNFSENNPSYYLSDFKRHLTRTINGPYSIILDDKILFDKVLSDEKITPKTYGKIYYGDIYLGENRSNLESLISLIKKEKTIIIKKQSGGGGKNIFRIQYINNCLIVNNKFYTKEDLNDLIKFFENYIISEYLKQADYSDKIYPGTINTIRVITMRDSKSGEVFIPIAVHKFGSKNTEPADNVWRGGLTAQVNIETGIIQQAALHHSKNKRIEWVHTHPDTNEIIESIQIPNWHKIRDDLIQLASKLNFLNYIGWDVVITNDGFQIIEGNNYSDVNILQIHQPLLIDERVKRFYKYYGIIKS